MLIGSCDPFPGLMRASALICLWPLSSQRPMGSGTQDQRRQRLASLRTDGAFHGASKGSLGLLQGQRQDSWRLDLVTACRGSPEGHPTKAQHPKPVSFIELKRAEENEGRHGDFIRFPFCWNPQGVGEERAGAEGKVFILFSPITAKLGNPWLLERRLREKGLCRNHLCRLAPPYQG